MDLLKLDEQICFPLYAVSRRIIQGYTPLLEELNLTYPQYLCMMVLWEEDRLSVGYIGKRLRLNSNTLTPLLKKMEGKGLLERRRSTKDERSVEVILTDKGRKMKQRAEEIPLKLLENTSIPLEKLTDMKERIWDFLAELEGLPDS